MSKLQPQSKPATSPMATRPVPAMPSRLTGLAGVQARNQSEWMKQGEYLLQVLSVKEGHTRAPALRPFFVVEARVMGNDDPDGSRHANRVGHTVSWMVMLDRDGAHRDVRAFLDAVLTAEEAAHLADPDTADEFVQNLLSDSQPLAGRTMMASAQDITTKAGKPFTKVRWFAGPMDAPAAHSAE